VANVPKPPSVSPPKLAIDSVSEKLKPPRNNILRFKSNERTHGRLHPILQEHRPDCGARRRLRLADAFPEDGAERGFRVRFFCRQAGAHFDVRARRGERLPSVRGDPERRRSKVRGGHLGGLSVLRFGGHQNQRVQEQILLQAGLRENGDRTRDGDLRPRISVGDAPLEGQQRDHQRATVQLLSNGHRDQSGKLRRAAALQRARDRGERRRNARVGGGRDRLRGAHPAILQHREALVRHHQDLQNDLLPTVLRIRGLSADQRGLPEVHRQQMRARRGVHQKGAAEKPRLHHRLEKGRHRVQDQRRRHRLLRRVEQTLDEREHEYREHAGRDRIVQQSQHHLLERKECEARGVRVGALQSAHPSDVSGLRKDRFGNGRRDDCHESIGEFDHDLGGIGAASVHETEERDATPVGDFERVGGKLSVQIKHIEQGRSSGQGERSESEYGERVPKSVRQTDQRAVHQIGNGEQQTGDSSTRHHPEGGEDLVQGVHLQRVAVDSKNELKKVCT
jgi:hypothetical protein